MLLAMSVTGAEALKVAGLELYFIQNTQQHHECFHRMDIKTTGCSPVLGFKLVILTTVHSAAYAKLHKHSNVCCSVLMPCSSR